MSALDQAFSKAYAKDRTPIAPLTVAPAHAPPAPPGVRGPSALAIEQLYYDGTLYRVEMNAASPTVPVSHLPQLPPTSPRRSVRRSLRRMLTAGSAAPATEIVSDRPRVARKVIIRHISHGSPPPPLGTPWHGEEAPAPVTAEPVYAARAELPPETIFDKPQPPPLPMTPAAPPPPQVAPLNLAFDTSMRIGNYGQWDHEAALAPMVVLAEAQHREPDSASLVVSVQLDGLTDAKVAIDEPELARPEPQSPADKDEPRPYVRLDAPHAHGRQGPHARFTAADEDAEPQQSPAAVAAGEQEAPEQPEARAENEGWPPEAHVPPSPEPLAGPLASDLVPLEQAAAAEAPSGDLPSKSASAAKPALPVWEVDRFQWPKACEKLLADENGYFSRAGDKLLAAVQDGLKVLAITGTRRGEGRSTLTLCLARAAAKAGIQTAIMDADFARPQLAGKVGLEIAYGWQDAALGRIPLSEAAVKSLADEITLLPLESSATTRSLSLADPRVTATIRAAAATFELLILDLSPVASGQRITFPSGEACPLDAAIVVRDERFTTPDDSETLGRTLQDAGVDAVGIAENFVWDEEPPATSH